MVGSTAWWQRWLVANTHSTPGKWGGFSSCPVLVVQPSAAVVAGTAGGFVFPGSTAEDEHVFFTTAPKFHTKKNRKAAISMGMVLLSQTPAPRRASSAAALRRGQPLAQPPSPQAFSWLFAFPQYCRAGADLKLQPTSERWPQRQAVERGSETLGLLSPKKVGTEVPLWYFTKMSRGRSFCWGKTNGESSTKSSQLLGMWPIFFSRLGIGQQ